MVKMIVLIISKGYVPFVFKLSHSLHLLVSDLVNYNCLSDLFQGLQQTRDMELFMASWIGERLLHIPLHSLHFRFQSLKKMVFYFTPYSENISLKLKYLQKEFLNFYPVLQKIYPTYLETFLLVWKVQGLLYYTQEIN